MFLSPNAPQLTAVSLHWPTSDQCCRNGTHTHTCTEAAECVFERANLSWGFALSLSLSAPSAVFIFLSTIRINYWLQRENPEYSVAANVQISSTFFLPSSLWELATESSVVGCVVLGFVSFFSLSLLDRCRFISPPTAVSISLLNAAVYFPGRLVHCRPMAKSVSVLLLLSINHHVATLDVASVTLALSFSLSPLLCSDGGPVMVRRSVVSNLKLKWSIWPITVILENFT